MTRPLFALISLLLFLVAAHTTSLVNDDYAYRWGASIVLVVLALSFAINAIITNDQGDN